MSRMKIPTVLKYLPMEIRGYCKDAIDIRKGCGYVYIVVKTNNRASGVKKIVFFKYKGG